MLASATITLNAGTAAKYFMIDGAVAMEAFNPGLVKNVGMVNNNWDDYYIGFPSPDDDRLFASEWYKIFVNPDPTAPIDPRSKLTWRGVFTDWRDTQVFNFYSSGEEVMANIPHDKGNDLADILDAISFSWGCQEKLKGRMPGEFLGSTIGGWAFNQTDYGTWIPPGQGGQPVWQRPDPASVHGTPASQLVTQPFFRKSPTDLFSSNDATAQNFAQQYYYDLLARAIPARTYGVGANAMGDVFGFAESTDMQTLQTGWPSSRGLDIDWLHSDCKNVAYPFNHKLFESIVNLGELE